MASRISVIRTQRSAILTHITNPADNTSRGLKIQKLLGSKSWLSGPEFLWKAEETWTPCELESTIDEVDPEIKRETSANIINVQNNNATNQLITYFSDWKRVKITSAWALKIKKALLELSHKRKQLLLAVSADIHHVSMEMFRQENQ